MNIRFLSVQGYFLLIFSTDIKSDGKTSVLINKFIKIQNY